jgi:hypothetical protein
LTVSTNGIEARGIEDHQAVLQQGMGQVDERMAPLRNFHHAVGVLWRIFLGQLIVPEAQRARLVHADG